jgi:hypothetical protein
MSSSPRNVSSASKPSSKRNQYAASVLKRKLCVPAVGTKSLSGCQGAVARVLGRHRRDAEIVHQRVRLAVDGEEHRVAVELHAVQIDPALAVRAEAVHEAARAVVEE